MMNDYDDNNNTDINDNNNDHDLRVTSFGTSPTAGQGIVIEMHDLAKDPHIRMVKNRTGDDDDEFLVRRRIIFTNITKTWS